MEAFIPISTQNHQNQISYPWQNSFPPLPVVSPTLHSPLPPLLETNPHTLCHNAFEVQNVWVVKLAHDCCLSKEVPPLAIWRRVLQGLNGHSLAVLTGDSQGPLIHFPKLS